MFLSTVDGQTQFTKYTQRSALDRTVRKVGWLVCLFTILPLFRGKSWWIRTLDFPRLQIAGMGALVLLSRLLKRKRPGQSDKLFYRCVFGAVAAQMMQIYRYTPLSPKQVISKPISTVDPNTTVSMFIANILMGNHQLDELLRVLERRDPDLVLLLEPDEWVSKELVTLEQRYRYCIKRPQNNTYGMLLYSKLELVGVEVRCLVQHDVPSIRTDIKLRNGQTVRFYGVHPKPPGRLNRDFEIRSSGPRDAELIVVAKEIQKYPGPVIVTGDFNDVAWSHTTRRFLRLTGLLDPRIGRGLYSTYHAQYPLLRFPVDHLFHSKDFTLVSFQRDENFGSDHFPIYAELSFTPEVAEVQQPVQATRTDHEEAQEDLTSPATKQS